MAASEPEAELEVPTFDGSADAFARALEHYETAVLRFCLRFVGDRELARDLAQDVFITLWRERARYQETGRLRSYLFRIARLRCLAALKKQKSRARLLDSFLDTHEPSAVPQDALSAARAVQLALSKIRPKYAEVVILRHLEGMSLEEMAIVTGLRTGTLKSRLSRGMSELKKEVSRV